MSEVGALQDEGTSQAKAQRCEQSLSETKVCQWMEVVVELGSSYISPSPTQLAGVSVNSMGLCGTTLRSQPGRGRLS